MPVGVGGWWREWEEERKGDRLEKVRTKRVRIDDTTHPIPAIMERRSVQKGLVLIGLPLGKIPSIAKTRRGPANKNRNPTRMR
jgi:hypothetical protein